MRPTFDGSHPKRSLVLTSQQLRRPAREAGTCDYILKTSKEHHGNHTRTAWFLGLERSHLDRKMKAFGVTVEE